jgi:transcriptional regulator with XRE-family HTH domain
MWVTVRSAFQRLSLKGGDRRVTSLKTIVGTNVRALRKLKGLSQATLAEMAELSTDMLGRIERGQASPSFETVEALASALAVSPSSLFGCGDFPDQGSTRGRALRQVYADLAQANDDQVALIQRLVAAVVERKG